MSFKTKKDLNSEIYDKLEGLMRYDCVLLNTPDHINIGDQLIWQGEMDFLETLGVYPKYITSLFNFDWRPLDQNTLILLHGGGNFGDVWENHQAFRKNIIERYKNNPILIFPQSVQYQNTFQLKADGKLFSKHPNLTICARDKFSFDLLSQYFDNDVLLVPDMAFCSKYKKNKGKSGRKLLMKRTDREINASFNYANYSDFEIRDWPTFDKTLSNYFYRIIEKINRVFLGKILKKRKPDTTFGVGVKRDRKYLTDLGQDFLSNYDVVVSTRLHGHILALIMGIPTIMIDNNYGKNNRFYETWLSDFPNSEIVTSEKELDLKLQKINF